MIQDISKILVGDVEAVKVYVGDVVVYEKSGDNQPNDEVWYTTTDGQIFDALDPNTSPKDINGNSLSIISNTYNDGKGIIKYSGDLYSIVPSGSSYGFTTAAKNLDTIIFPASLKVMYSGYSRGLLVDFLDKPINEIIFKGVERIGHLVGNYGYVFNKIVLPATLTTIDGYLTTKKVYEFDIKENDVFYGSNTIVQDKNGCVRASGLNPQPPAIVKKVADYGFIWANLSHIDLSQVIEIGQYGMDKGVFNGEVLNLPNVTKIGNFSLRDIDASIIYCYPTSVGNYALSYFKGKSINTDEEGVVDFTYYNGNLPNGLFQYCTTIKEFRLGDVKSVGTYTFDNCPNAEIYDFSRCTSMFNKKANSLTINANTIIKVPNALLSDFITGWADVPSDRFVGV